MAKTVFRLESLHKIDALKEDFDRQLKAAVEDCRERPGLKQAREVTVKLKIVPHAQDADDVVVHVQTTSKTPTRAIDPYRMQRTMNDGLKFQPNSPIDPDQESFDFGEE